MHIIFFSSDLSSAFQFCPVQSCPWTNCLVPESSKAVFNIFHHLSSTKPRWRRNHWKQLTIDLGGATTSLDADTHVDSCEALLAKKKDRLLDLTEEKQLFEHCRTNAQYFQKISLSRQQSKNNNICDARAQNPSFVGYYLQRYKQK